MANLIEQAKDLAQAIKNRCGSDKQQYVYPAQELLPILRGFVEMAELVQEIEPIVTEYDRQNFAIRDLTKPFRRFDSAKYWQGQAAWGEAARDLLKRIKGEE